MKLYQTPSGTIQGTEKDWRASMNAEGHDTKQWPKERCIVEVPTAKPALMEFLTFHSVNIINPPPAGRSAGGEGAPPPASPPSAVTTVPDLDEAFEAAPLPQQISLAVGMLDRIEQKLK